MYVLPSVSTFTNRNPSVTRFEYNKDTFELLDYTVRDGVMSMVKVMVVTIIA